MRIPTLLPLAMAAGVAGAQPVTRLAKPDVEFSAELSNIVGVRELPDGRVIVLDRKEKKILLLDVRGQETPIGREGSGPGEYLRPYVLVALGADTTLVEDSGNRRFLVLGPGGKVLNTIPTIVMRPQEGVTYSITPRGSDAQGRLYMPMPTGLAPGERIPILRLDRAREKFDTVATVRNERYGVQRGRPAAVSGGASFGMMAAQPWVVKDEWVVMPDGSVAIAHNQPYSVDWVSPAGVLSRGAPIPFTPVKVTEAEREKWREQQREAGGATLTTTGADGKTTVRKLPVLEPDAWPVVMPAFSGSGAVLAAPNGVVWIQRLGAASAATVTYDVIDRRGMVIERVELPEAHRVIGFGRGTVYVVRQDEDGLQHLQRYARK